MSDLFHERVPDEFIDRVFDVMRRASHHVFQVLTKRSERMVEWHRAHHGGPVPWHIWVGVSVESPSYFARIDHLRRLDVPVRFISAEPLLAALTGINLEGIAWLITGGESGGPNERALVTRTQRGWCPKPDALMWVRELREACRAGRTAFFHKQWGGPTPKSGGRLLDRREWNEMPAPARETASISL
jgi:protein gp37